MANYHCAMCGARFDLLYSTCPNLRCGGEIHATNYEACAYLGCTS